MSRQQTRPTLAAAQVVTLAGIFSLLGVTHPAGAAIDAPSGLPASPLSGLVGQNGATATDFSQAMLRFEEFGVHPIPAPGSTAAKAFPAPVTCSSRPPAAGMDAFLDDTAPLWPDPSREANIGLGNPWELMIEPCIGFPPTFTGVIEGRPPGEDFAHQRWDEFAPQVYFQSAMGGSRANGGIRDDEQRHGWAAGTEFGPGGLYYNTVGPLGSPPAPLAQFNGSFDGIAIKLHPNLPEQDPLALWTFGDGTLPPKLLQARYGLPILFRHYNALPIDAAANFGFGEHTITTHEHNGHQPGESDGFAGAFYFPGEFYDYRWPMALAGHDSINRDASDPRASTPCSPGEELNVPDPISGVPVAKTCDPDTLTVNIPGDWHEIMSTHWFHDHMIDRTAENVYKGNAAMMNYYSGIDRGKEGFRCEYEDPKNNINLCFPSGTALDWGNRDYDVQLLVADKAWAPVTGQLDMAVVGGPAEDGFLGDRMTVNWLYKPYLDVRARRYRLRILNGAVARYFKIAIVREYNDGTTGEFPGPPGPDLVPVKSYDRVPFHMIANDGNIMQHAIPFPNPQSNDLPVQAIAERYDIVLDFKGMEGAKLYMVNTLSHDDGRGPKDIIPLADILSEAYLPEADFSGGCTENCWDLDPTVGKFLELRVHEYTGTDLSMNPADYEVGKKMMIPLVKATDAEIAAATHRTFDFVRAGGTATDGRNTPWAIETDGGGALHADVGVVAAAPETMGGGWEIWHIRGGGGWSHPVHIHFEEGQILARVDEVLGVDVPRRPPLWEMGARKDLYRIGDLGQDLGIPDSSRGIDVLIRFREFAGTFVEHCHNTTHEDKAMLLRWDNEVPGQTVRIRTPRPTWEGVGYDTPTELATIKTGDLDAAAAYVAPTQLTADLDWNGLVTLNDFATLRSQFGQWGLLAANLNEEGPVSLADYILFRQEFGLADGLADSPFNPLP